MMLANSTRLLLLAGVFLALSSCASNPKVGVVSGDTSKPPPNPAPQAPLSAKSPVTGKPTTSPKVAPTELPPSTSTTPSYLTFLRKLELERQLATATMLKALGSKPSGAKGALKGPHPEITDALQSYEQVARSLASADTPQSCQTLKDAYMRFLSDTSIVISELASDLTKTTDPSRALKSATSSDRYSTASQSLAHVNQELAQAFKSSGQSQNFEIGAKDQDLIKGR